jgi:pimeloyl-ACP methyl ester carboxylesterase
MPTVNLGDVTIAYDVAGPDDGEPVVLVCGCGGPAVGWFAVVPPLADAGYRVVTFDNRGMPPSSSPPAPYSVADLVDDALGLCDHLGIERARFAGHSMGGWVAECLAVRFPDRVRAAVFMGSCNVATAWEKAITTVEVEVARRDLDLPPLFFAAETLRYLPNHDLQDDDVVETWLALLGENEPWANPGRQGQYEACLAWSFDPAPPRAWPSITVPCMVMAFEHDIDSPPARAREAAAMIPGARFVEIAAASHLGPFTHPDAVVAGLLDFFATA